MQVKMKSHRYLNDSGKLRNFKLYVLILISILNCAACLERKCKARVNIIN